MSGGTFDYNQDRIRDIANGIEREIYNSGRKKTEQEIKDEKRYSYPGFEIDLSYYEYPKEVMDEFIKAYKVLRVAEIYAHRIDWLLSGDDGNETFINRLREDLRVFDNELTVKKSLGFRPEYDEED